MLCAEPSERPAAQAVLDSAVLEGVEPRPTRELDPMTAGEPASAVPSPEPTGSAGVEPGLCRAAEGQASPEASPARGMAGSPMSTGIE